jgi:type IV secretion system protein VirB9
MDAGRLLALASLALLVLSGCGTTEAVGPGPSVAEATLTPPKPPAAAEPPGYGTMAPIPDPPTPARRPAPAAPPAGSSPAGRSPLPDGGLRVALGRPAISLANAQSREPSRSDAFVGGLQVFTYAPGRVFEVWTAPLRVTTLTLGPGETLTAKAAGDTVRWQIGETTSGAGVQQRTHVLIKPLERGLETNLVLATNQRVYLVQLKSGAPETFNAAVAWDLGVLAPPETSALTAAGPAGAAPPAAPAGPLDAGYRITPRGRAPRWSPTSVATDGIRTFIAFPHALQADEAPALFVVGADGQSQMVNYRQQGALMVVDRVVDRAELRLGDRRPQIVRIGRIAGTSR